MTRVVLYTRQGCGLCDDVLPIILRLQPALGFEFDVVDIEGDEALRSRYGEAIPVVEAEGRIIAQAPVDADALKRELAAAVARTI